MAKIDIAGELNAATTERIVADSAQIRFQDTTVKKAMVTYGDSDEVEDVPGGGGGDDPGTVTASIPSILLSELDNLNMDAVHGNGDSIYKVMLAEGGFSVGILQMFSDNMAHVATQVFITHYTDPGTWLIHNDDEVYTYYRSYAMQKTTAIPQDTWSEWKNIVLPSVANLLPPYATSSKYGTVKLGSDVVQAIAAEEPQSETGRTYPVQKDGDGKLVVNVPGGSASSSVLVFDGIEDGEITILNSTAAEFTDIIWSSHNKKFAAKTADGQYYSNWPRNERYDGNMLEYEDGRLFALVPKTIAPAIGFTNSIYARYSKKLLGTNYTSAFEKIAEVNITYSNATPSADGLMSKEDKAKVDSALTGDGVTSVKVVTELPEVQEDNTLYIVIAKEA